METNKIFKRSQLQKLLKRFVKLIFYVILNT